MFVLSTPCNHNAGNNAPCVGYTDAVGQDPVGERDPDADEDGHEGVDENDAAERKATRDPRGGVQREADRDEPAHTNEIQGITMNNAADAKLLELQTAFAEQMRTWKRFGEEMRLDFNFKDTKPQNYVSRKLGDSVTSECCGKCAGAAESSSHLLSVFLQY